MTEFSKEVRSLIRSRADSYCEICGRERLMEYHHRRTRGMGGARRPETGAVSNGLGLCHTCHHMVGQYPNVAQLMGWRLSQYEQPIAVTVVYRGRRVWLDDNGNLREALV